MGHANMKVKKIEKTKKKESKVFSKHGVIKDPWSPGSLTVEGVGQDPQGTGLRAGAPPHLAQHQAGTVAAPRQEG